MNWRKHSIWIYVSIIVLIPIAAFAVISWYDSRFKALPIYESEGHSILDFQLKNQDGKMISKKDWEGKIVVVDFFFSHCPVVCPKMTRNLSLVQKEFLGDEDVLINSFSVDPLRDSLGRLNEYASQFGINTSKWNLLTGEKQEIYKLARKSFLVSATDGDGGPDDFIHSDQLVLLDDKMRIRGYYDGTNTTSISQLIIDIKKLKTERSR